MPGANLATRSKGSLAYSHLLTGTLRDLIAEAEQDTSHDVSSELAVLRGMLGMLLKKLDEEDDLPIRDAVKLIKGIRETIQLASEQENYVHKLAVKAFMQGVMTVVREEVKDDTIVRRIVTGLRKLAVPASRRESKRFAEASGAGEVPTTDA